MTNAEHGYEYTNKETGQKVKADTRQPHLENARWTSRVLTAEDNSRDERIAELEAENAKLSADLDEAKGEAVRLESELAKARISAEDGDTGSGADDKPAAAPKTPAKAPAKAKASDGNSADAS